MIYGLIGALLIGLTLGLMGSGGSAITVPVLVYLVGHSAKQSIAESMAIVGFIALVAAIPYARHRLISWRSVVYFGFPGLAGTLIGVGLGGLTSAALQLAVFGIVLLIAAVGMVRQTALSSQNNAGGDDGRDRGKVHDRDHGKDQGENNCKHENTDSVSRTSGRWKLMGNGLFVGVITGFVGVGGGFLIVPALQFFERLPLKMAMGTSLMIIPLNAIVGFTAYQPVLEANNLSIDWATVGKFAVVGVLGSLVGKSLNQRLNAKVLTKLFVAFLVLLGGFIIVREGTKILTQSRTTACLQHNATFPERPQQNIDSLKSHFK